MDCFVRLILGVRPVIVLLWICVHLQVSICRDCRNYDILGNGIVRLVVVVIGHERSLIYAKILYFVY